MPTLLRLHSVAHFYGSRLVFKGVSLSVRANSVTLLAGANGAGKSTLMRIMAGLTRPSSGRVEVADTPDGEIQVGYLGHQTFIYPELTALENLAFWSGLYRQKYATDTLLDMLRRVELEAFAEEKAKCFSRGMAQRLNLARVFLFRPSLLLLDEPGTGLDTRSTGILHREIAAAKAKGAGIVWITHNPAADAPRADMAALLDKKTLRYYGPASGYPEDGGPIAPPPLPAVEPESPDTRRAQGGELC